MGRHANNLLDIKKISRIPRTVKPALELHVVTRTWNVVLADCVCNKKKRGRREEVEMSSPQGSLLGSLVHDGDAALHASVSHFLWFRI